MGLKQEMVSFRHLEIVIRDRFMNAISHGGGGGGLVREDAPTKETDSRRGGTDSSLPSREGESCSDSEGC